MNPVSAVANAFAAGFFLLATHCVEVDDPLPSEPVFTVRLLDGTKKSGRLAEITENLTIRIQDTEGNPNELPLDQLFSIARADSEPSRPRRLESAILLAGGDLLTGQVVSSDSDLVKFRSGNLGTCDLNLDSVEGIILDPSLDPTRRDEIIEAVRTQPRESDAFWLANGDMITGSLVEITDQEVLLEREGMATSLPRAQVVGIGLDPALVRGPEGSERALEIHTRVGGRITSSSLRLESGAIQFELGPKARLQIPLDEVSRIYARSPRVTFVTDRQIAAQENVGYVGPPMPALMNRNPIGKPIRIGGRSIPRGIGTQSRTLLAFRIEPTDRRFQAEVAIDDAASDLGSVVFRVVLDRETAFESDVLRKGDPAQFIDVSLEGKQLLLLITEFGPHGSVQDYADWIEARLVK
jgi:NPCBM/NEW2 domain